MNERQTHLDSGFGLKWLVSCAIGTVVFGMAAYGSMWRLVEGVVQTSDELIRVLMAGGLFGALFALGGTLGPGLLLRRVGISAGHWIGYSVMAAALAMSSGTALIFSQDYPIQQAISTVFVGLALGLPMGLVQWHLLKQQGIPAQIWPLITIGAYTLGFGIVVFFSGEGREWIVLSGMGLSVGAITALGMVRSLRLDKILALLCLTLMFVACSGSGNNNSEARVFFTNVADGDTVDSPVTVRWGAENFIIEPAGEVKEGAGHLHIILDVPCVAASETVPADDNHLHYGKAQTEAILELTPGEHTLCLQAADGIHTALAGDGATETITVTVR